MAHSVQRHLAVAPDVYDVEIRRFVPGYDTLLDEAADALAEHLPDGRGTVLDLGAGTGALSARVAARLPAVRLCLLDADAALLAQAATRLAAVRERVSLRTGSFTDALPRCDAAVASLALHHVHERDAKREVYRGVRLALPPGGVLVSADAFVPAAPALAEPLMQRWAAHLVAHGDGEAQAYARFAEWALEDRYLGLDEELDLLRAAGFAAVDVRWRQGPVAVLVARAA
jgi:tRNA (cmo5U34)-methyltransferase